MSIRSSGWMDQAACLDVGTDLFFAPDGEREPGREAREKAAKAVCARCEVASECLAYSLGAYGGRKSDGIWGGLNDDERAVAKRNLMRRGEFTAA